MYIYISKVCLFLCVHMYDAYWSIRMSELGLGLEMYLCIYDTHIMNDKNWCWLDCLKCRFFSVGPTDFTAISRVNSKLDKFPTDYVWKTVFFTKTDKSERLYCGIADTVILKITLGKDNSLYCEVLSYIVMWLTLDSYLQYRVFTIMWLQQSFLWIECNMIMGCGTRSEEIRLISRFSVVRRSASRAPSMGLVLMYLLNGIWRHVNNIY